MSAALILALALAFAPPEADRAPTAAQAVPRQTEADAYTRYELLAPGSGAFRIVYEVTAATPGAIWYFNPIRKGSVATDERVSDRATGQALAFEVVPGAQAKTAGLPEPDPATDYIRVRLARPVPSDGGGGRVLIEKTYADPKSYFSEGDELVFSRPLGIKRNAVVLPVGYAPVACNYPSQVLQQPDGRIAISFFNITPAEAPLVLRARRANIGPGASSQAARLEERARQTRDIVYFLQPPESHAFRLYHDYTEARPGTDAYVNVVRAGSRAADPSARDLDTGETLKAVQIKGQAIASAGLDPKELPAAITPDTEVVVFRFPAVKPGGSTRLRMSETYVDPESYKLVGDELVWRRTLGRPANAVVLPRGWVLTNSSIPAVVTQTADGLTRLDLDNPRLDELDVTITARRTGAGK